jgi:hypothetical protein
VCQPAVESASQVRAASSSKKEGLPNEELAKAMSYKNRPYISNVKTGVTDYKYNFGEKIGNHPKEILNEQSIRQPIKDNPLKHGTNQLWT